MQIRKLSCDFFLCLNDIVVAVVASVFNTFERYVQSSCAHMDVVLGEEEASEMWKNCVARVFTTR